MLYVKPAVRGELIVIVPVVVVQVGCVTVTLAIAGAPDAGLITIGALVEIQLLLFFTVMVYDPGATLLKTKPAWNTVPFIL
jgi:hypothetical protein